MVCCVSMAILLEVKASFYSLQYKSQWSKINSENMFSNINMIDYLVAECIMLMHKHINKGHLFVIGRICCCFSAHDFSIRAAWVSGEANGRQAKQL